MSETTWQAIPAKELTRLANVLRETQEKTLGVLHTSLQNEIHNVEIMLRYHAEQAPHYNEAAGL